MIKLNKEKWKDVVCYEGFYKVSSYGRIKSQKRTTTLGGIIKASDQNGYSSVDLCKENKRKTYTVHSLVATAFLKKEINKKEVNHKNCNKKDNRVSNLEWVTSSENKIHANKNGLQKGCVKVAKKIIQKELNGKIIKLWGCLNDAARELDLDTSGITRCCKGQYKNCGGYKWEYA